MECQGNRKYFHDDPKDDMARLQLHQKWPLDLKGRWLTDQFLGHMSWSNRLFDLKGNLEIDYIVQYPEVRWLVKIKLKLRVLTPKLTLSFRGWK